MPGSSLLMFPLSLIPSPWLCCGTIFPHLSVLTLPIGGLIWTELRPQHSKDSGEGYEFQEEPSLTLYHPVWLPSWHCGVLLLHGHHCQPKNSAGDVPPAAAEEAQYAKVSYGGSRQHYHWVYPHLLHHHLAQRTTYSLHICVSALH